MPFEDRVRKTGGFGSIAVVVEVGTEAVYLTYTSPHDETRRKRMPTTDAAMAVMNTALNDLDGFFAED
jgi:hypothetical protein